MTMVPALRRCIAAYVALVLLLLAPMIPMHQALADAPGIKKIAGVALVGGAALFAMKALCGPASAVATVGCAGTAAACTTGGAIGTMMGGVKAVFGTIATGARSLLAAVGLCGGSTAATAATVATRPMWLVPVALIGAGLLAYYFYKKHYGFEAYTTDNVGRYDRTSGQRYNDYTYRNQVGLPTIKPTTIGGYYGNGITYTPSSFMDRFKTAVTGGRYMSSSTLQSGFYGGVGDFYTGGAAAFSERSPSYLNGFGTATIVGPNGISGSAYDISGIGDPSRLGRTDSIGRGLTVGDETARLNRANMQTVGAPETTKTEAAPSADLAKAQEAKASAYNRMIEAIKQSTDGVPNTAVTKAIDDYRAAEARVKELAERK